MVRQITWAHSYRNISGSYFWHTTQLHTSHRSKAKTAARNNVLKKLSISKWGANPATIKTIALALSYSTTEYACPVWERSAHAHKVNSVLNDECRSIAECLQRSNIDKLCCTRWYQSPCFNEKCCCTKRERGRTMWAILDIHYMDTQFQRNVCNQEVASCMNTDKMIDSPSTHTPNLTVVHPPNVCIPQSNTAT